MGNWWFDVNSEVGGSRSAEFLVLGGHEVHQVGMIGAAAPSPTLRQLDVETHKDGVGGFEEVSDPRRTRRRRCAGFPSVLDAAFARAGLSVGNGKLVPVVPSSLEQSRIVEALAEQDMRWFSSGASWNWRLLGRWQSYSSAVQGQSRTQSHTQSR